MMDQIVPERKWHLIRNDNGEWISDDNVVEVSRGEALILTGISIRTKKGLSFQHGMEGSLWCYKHEMEQIDLTSINYKKTKQGTLKIKKKMKKETGKYMYYHREISSDLESLINTDYKWLIDEVIRNPELDFQIGSNDNDSWFSIYRGTGRVLTIKRSGIIVADPKYMKMHPTFYDKPDKNGLHELLDQIHKDTGLGRYYIGADCKKKEGYYQNLISRRYSLFCEPEDDFIIIDKEFVLGYADDTIKKEITEPIKEKYDGIIQTLACKYDYCKHIKQSGTECDFVGLTREGDILLLELKRHEDTTKIYLSPLQTGKYDDLTKEFAKRYPEDFSCNIMNMVAQKKRMGILKPKWPIPAKTSGRIIPAVVVGGDASQEAKKRFVNVRDAVGKDITLYTCDEKGTLIKVL